MKRLLTLDKKLHIVQHKMTPQQLMEFKMSDEELKKLVQQNIYNRVIQLLFQTTKISMEAKEDGIVWTYKMFMFTERDFLNTLMEVCELSDEDRLYTIAECKKGLGMFTNVDPEPK